MSDANFYIAVATVAPLFVLTVGLSTVGFRKLNYVLLGFTNNNKAFAGLITLVIGLVNILLGTVCEIISLVALHQNGASGYWRNSLLVYAIGLVVVSFATLFLLLLYSVIVEGDAASTEYKAYEVERLERLKGRQGSGEG